jgi:hypothetical protein
MLKTTLDQPLGRVMDQSVEGDATGGVGMSLLSGTACLVDARSSPSVNRMHMLSPELGMTITRPLAVIWPSRLGHMPACHRNGMPRTEGGGCAPDFSRLRGVLRTILLRD